MLSVDNYSIDDLSIGMRLNVDSLRNIYDILVLVELDSTLSNEGTVVFVGQPCEESDKILRGSGVIYTEYKFSDELDCEGYDE